VGHSIALRRSWRLQRCIEPTNKPVTVDNHMSPKLPWFTEEAWVATW
jgi:hypothetical protein